MEFQSPSLQQFQEKLNSEPSLLMPSLLMEGLWSAPKALLIALLQQATQKNILVLTAESKMSKLLDDADYFKIQGAVEFPSWETLPGEEIAPSPDIVGKRLLILHELLQKKLPQVVICPLQSALQKVPSPAFLEPRCKLLKKGDEIPFSTLPTWLSEVGYRRTSVVVDKGEFAIRGGILDIYPVGSPDPIRIEFFGDTIDNLRTFDPIGQKSTGKTTSIFISPAVEDAILMKDAAPTSILSYLGENTLVIFDDLLALEDKYVAFQSLPGSKSKLFLTFDDLLKELNNFQKIYWTENPIEELSEVHVGKKVGRAYYTGKEPLQPLTFEFFHRNITTKRWHHPFVPVQGYLPTLERSPHLDIHFICASDAEEKHLREKIKIPPKSHMERGYLSSGFALCDSNILLIPMTEITHRQKVRREKWRNTYHTPPSDFHELVPGDLVVHFHHGIGKYLGIEKKPNHLGVETEFLTLEYAERSKLYVPVSQAYLVSRYIGTKEEIPTLHTLGTKNWQRTKAHAQKAIVGYAQDLLRISAERTVQGGFVFPADDIDMLSFEDEFPYSETDDQLRAIQEIKNDMMSSKAMDRLLCGDVGYGKTEVALRAAFKAVEGKKQVAVLVPTTVLALQHFETFTDRMANHPITIRVVSRFQSVKEVKKTLEEVSEGKVDILIGTHRLLSKDVKFKDLGLIIIDEEQRFGVRSKEHLKALKSGVDCLTLTATPIPRTLYLSLVGAREISLINTPPQDRLPIKTIIAERDPEVISNALLRELSRDGQVYFIHNRVESIYTASDELKKLLPQARVVTGHGQMDADEIDTVFHTFKKGDADILVATTIVENGIDIPNANTILIDRADAFGLSDLYQLRGRVGRWNRPAYAYFLVPKLRELPEISRKRLYALLEAQGYGGGMKIAMRDLEIRGAGDILGVQQSGHVSSIGFHLYCKLLKRTVDALKKKLEPTFLDTKMEFPYDARLPEDYIHETSLRLEIYHRLGETSTLEEVDGLFEELKDRFGKPPTPVIWLYHLTRIRTVAAQKRYTLLKFNSHTLDTERQTAKGSVKKLFSLKPFKSPTDLEKQVLENI